MGLGDGKRLWQSQSLSFYDTWGKLLPVRRQDARLRAEVLAGRWRTAESVWLTGKFLPSPACIGFVGVIGVRVLVLGDSFDGLHSKGKGFYLK